MAIHRLATTALEGEPGAYFAPTYKMLSAIWREFNKLLDPVIVERNVQEHRLGLLGGGIIDFWSLDQPNTARGRKYARAVIDEAAMVADLEEAFNAVIRPTLTNLHGDADLLSTPKGRNFFWRCWVRGQDKQHPEWASWTFPTVANEYIDPNEVEAARQQLPERTFKQEYLAEFLEESGGVFRNVNAAVDLGRQNGEPEPGRSYTLGVDLARVEDFTVLCVMDGTGKQVYHERFNQISWERQCSTIHAVATRYRAPIVLDSTGVGDPIYERLRQAGLAVDPYQFTNASKERLIDFLAMQIEQGKVRLLDVPDQTNELLAYQYELTPSRNVRMNAPEGMHDDCVIGLALAAWGALQAGYYSAGAF
jgi:Terminase RNaseH-like domain